MIARDKLDLSRGALIYPTNVLLINPGWSRSQWLERVVSGFVAQSVEFVIHLIEVSLHTRLFEARSGGLNVI